MPHVPQLVASRVTSTQRPPQVIDPVGHAQAPARQTWAERQVVPHAPQLEKLVWRSMQRPLQSESPEEQRQVPAVQVALKSQ